MPNLRLSGENENVNNVCFTTKVVHAITALYLPTAADTPNSNTAINPVPFCTSRNN